MSFDLQAQINAGVKTLQPYQPGKPITEVERELGLDSVIKLASNENPLGPSGKAVAAMQQALSSLSLYPDGGGFYLKQAIADKFNLNPEQITLGNGSNDVLDLIGLSFVSDQDSVVYSQHSFVVYSILTKIANAEAIEVPALDYGHDLDAMLAAIKPNTKAVFIANPNNPTGTWLSRAKVEHFLANVPEQVLVVMDEAYCEYIDEPTYPNSFNYLNQYPNLIVTRTFSKAYGLAGLRVGYAVSSPEVAEVINRVRPPFNVNSLSLVAAQAVLDDEDYLARGFRVNKLGLAQVSQGLDDLGLSYIPSLANFICFDSGRNGKQVFDALLQKGVIVRPMGPGMESFIRVSIGLEDENKVFLEALAQVLNEVPA